MGGEENGEIILLPHLVEHVEELSLPLDVHTGERLVQDEDMGNRFQRHGQQDPLELSAGERADALIHQGLGVDPAQAAEDPFPQLFRGGQKNRPVRDGGDEQVQHAHRVAAVEAGALGHIADERTGVFSAGALEVDLTGVGQLSQDRPEQGGLSRPVGADEGGDFPAVEMEIHVFQNDLVTHGYPKVGHLEAAGTVTAGTGEIVMLAYAHCTLTCPSLSALAMVSTFSEIASQ